MRKIFRLVLLSACFGFSLSSFAQADSILVNGIYRNFILHLPQGYSTARRYPLVLNLHGLNSNALEQEAYTRYDAIADTAGFIVAYPNAVNESWDLAGTSDVIFLSRLADSLQAKYSTNNCLFSTGMSMGGFMTYKLACNLSSRLTAIAVVAGNMPVTLQNNCAVASGLPVMHFHGTADPIVSYTGSLGIPPVETTVNWWVTKNKCSTTATVTTLPNISTTDNSYAEQYDYPNGSNGSMVTFYKIYNGGHTWPSGIIDIPSFGNTNRDVDASLASWLFFSRFCSSLNLFRWNGSVSEEWENPANWDNGKLPTSYSRVIIPSTAPHFPKLAASTAINSLELKPGSSVTLNNGILLVIESR